MHGLRFLSVGDVLELHRETIDIEGGSHGIRDLGLLESAVGMPQQSFGGVFLHEDLTAMAAAYLYHLSGNHPFVDGNKRAAVLAALVFLEENGILVTIPPKLLEEVVLNVAASRMTKDELTTWLREHLG